MSAADRIENVTWLVAATLCALVAARLVSFAATEVRPPNTASASPEKQSQRHRKRHDKPRDRTREEGGREDGGLGRDATSKHRIRPQLFVDFGPPRSEVWVDGALLGQTPYIGELSCIEGSLVRVEVRPAQGTAREFKGQCEGETLRIQGPP